MLQCDFVVQKYGPLIVQYIFSAMTPKAICEVNDLIAILAVASLKILSIFTTSMVNFSDNLVYIKLFYEIYGILKNAVYKKTEMEVVD